MKKKIIKVLLLLLLIPILVNAETCNTENIIVESIEWIKKSGNIEEKSTAIGKNININLSMLNVGDNIEYKIMVKNYSNEDYELNKDSFNMNSDYVNYNVEFEDDSNIVKANSIKAINLKIEYKNKVPEDKFELGTKNDNNSILLSFFSENNKKLTGLLKNPNTGNSLIFVVLIILLISGISFIILKKTKYIKYIILIIGTIITIPISAYALCKHEIIIESNVTIRQTREVTFYKQWKLYSANYEYMMVPTNEFHNFIDLYMTSDLDYDANHPNQTLSESLKKVDSPIVPEIINVDSGSDYGPSISNDWIKYWYKITYNVPKYDENGNELHYILKENHIYGLDLLGGGPESNLGYMAFDPYDKNYNRVGITDEESELLVGTCKNTTRPNDQIYYVDCLPVMITPNEHYLYGIGEEGTLSNFIVPPLTGGASIIG